LKRAVFLDRDGVINTVVLRAGKPASPRTLEEFQLEPEIEKPLRELRAANLALLVVTNQPDIARGRLRPEVLAQFHRQVLDHLPIEAIEVCPHDDADGCLCRKPKPGMLTALAARRGVELRHSFMIGDSWRDMQTARAAGCAAIILDRAYNRADDADWRVASLAEAARLILNMVGDE